MQQQSPWNAYAICTVTQPGDRPASLTYLDGRPDEICSGFDYFFWVLVRGDEVIVVDTGFSEADCRRIGRQWNGSPAELLARIGIDAAKVTQVLLTHAHPDHVGNLHEFPNATFWIQQAEMESLAGEDMSHAFFRHAYAREDALALIGLLYDDRLRFLDGDGTFAEGVDYALVGGHARGQMVLRVATRRGPVLLASDAVHLYEEARSERPFFVFQNMEEMLAGYRTCRRLAGEERFLIPGHDKLVSRLYPPARPGLEGLIMDLAEDPAEPQPAS
ncbi:N-acyl homoserine lactonase family protein [Paracoccus sp. J39]|uniref:N-acyl homoserine lactonase family protein n=1 Tax=Paracoccus sp. J39 TaxID=935848 RepID=UPI00048BB73E|nr:N-acyl homoserine lactonase family protein [Paracoccus sp. J39]